MLDSSITYIYGWPSDSETGKNIKYFQLDQNPISTSYSSFSNSSRVRRGDSYVTRQDIGLTRSMSCVIYATNKQTINFYEYIFRNTRDELIFPDWRSYARISSINSTEVVIDSEHRNISGSDRFILLSQDYSKYSLRSSVSYSSKTFEFEESPNHSFVAGDFFVPMFFGIVKERPQFKYEDYNETAKIKLTLYEVYPSGGVRNLI